MCIKCKTFVLCRENPLNIAFKTVFDKKKYPFEFVYDCSCYEFQMVILKTGSIHSYHSFIVSQESNFKI